MVEQKVQSKLKSLGVNLSRERLQQWSDKISKRFTEESTDEEINAYVDDFKDLIIEQAKQDDRLRSLENQKPKADTPPVEPPKDDTPEWAKALLKEVEQLKTEKLQDTLKNQFLSDEKVKGVPKTLLETLAPKSAEEYDTAIERANAIALEFNKSLPDTTPKTSSANPKPATEVDIKNLAKEILN